MENFFTPELLWQLGLGILSLVISAVLPLLANQLRHYLLQLRDKAEAEIGSERFNLIWNFTETMIRAAEQHLGLETNAAKKTYVVDAVYTFATAQGWPLTHEQIDDIVEGVFNAIKPSLNGDAAVFTLPR